jgi:hypothetical protein
MSIFDKAAEAHERKIAEEQAGAAAAERQWEEARQQFRARFMSLVETVARPLFQSEAASATLRGYAAEVVELSSPAAPDPYIDFRYVPTRGVLSLSSVPATQIASFRLSCATNYQSVEYQMLIDQRRTPDVVRKGRLDELEVGLEQLFEDFLVSTLNRDA